MPRLRNLRPPRPGAARYTLLLGLTLAAVLVGCRGFWGPVGVLPDPPGAPLPLETRLEPGLAVRYWDVFVRHVDELPREETLLVKSRGGPPLRFIDHQFGRGEVFDSGTNRGIGLEITGFIRLDRTGTYRFQTLSNDGVRVYLDGRTLIDDPAQHSDQLSPEARLEVVRPAWYPLGLRYFQRKGTAALVLYWQPPGAAGLQPVPPEAFGHRPPPG
jgi:hypothetical protein